MERNLQYEGTKNSTLHQHRPASIIWKKSTKIHSFLKQCLRNLPFFKKQGAFHETSCSIQVPCFDKLKIVHNTVLKMNGL